MQIFTSLDEFSRTHSNCVATIGKYDGLHLGHQSILRELIKQAKNRGLPALVVLSEPQPEEFFNKQAAPPRLSQFTDKVALLESIGIDGVFKMTFDHSLSQLSAQNFIKRFVVEGLGVKALVVGHDFAFGHKRSGNVTMLEEFGQEFGFSVTEGEPFVLQGERISSTLVRSCLEEGNCARVFSLLGRHFSITGSVISGRKLGRELGFPTANISLGYGRPPLTGVYAVRVKYANKVCKGVANIGYRPTVGEEKQAVLEVHLFHNAGDLYGQVLDVSFLSKLRDEKRFENVEELRSQISEDVSKAKALFWKQEAHVA